MYYSNELRQYNKTIPDIDSHEHLPDEEGRYNIKVKYHIGLIPKREGW
jgi:hypothetical protein